MKFYVQVLTTFLLAFNVISIAQVQTNKKEKAQNKTQIKIGTEHIARDQNEINDFKAKMDDYETALNDSNMMKVKNYHRSLTVIMEREIAQTEEKLNQAKAEVVDSKKEVVSERREIKRNKRDNRRNKIDKKDMARDQRNKRDDRRDMVDDKNDAKFYSNRLAKQKALLAKFEKDNMNFGLIKKFYKTMLSDQKQNKGELKEDRKEIREDRGERRDDRKERREKR